MAEDESRDQEAGQPDEPDQAGGPAKARRLEDLPPAARRALEEAEARRREMDARPPLPPEIDGRDGPEPVRYGDWEKKGIAVDF